MNNTKYHELLHALTDPTITQAAKECGYTQSGMTHLVAGIEKDWGVTLLQRSRKGTALTLEGEALLPYVQQLVNALDALDTEVQACKGLEVGNIRIGAFASVAASVLPGIIGAFKQLHPRVSFTIEEGSYADVEHALRQGRIDIGFLVDGFVKDFDARAFDADRIMFVTSCDDASFAGSSFAIDKLGSQPFIMLEEGERNRFRALLAEHEIDANIQFSAKEHPLALSLISQGLGVAFVYELCLRDNPYPVRAVPLEPAQTRTIYLATKPARTLSPLVDAFCEFALAFPK